MFLHFHYTIGGHEMKRNVSYVLLTLVMILVLAGCGSSGQFEGNTGGAGAEGSTEIEGKDLSAKELLKGLEYDPLTYVKLPKDFRKLELKVEGDYEYTDEKFKEYINGNLSYFNTYTAVDKDTVEKGDFVNIDYEGKIGGKAFEGGTAKGYELEIGSGSFIEGFEEGLIGKKKGETVDLKLKFPDDYQNPDFAGKEAVFTVTINSIDEAKAVTYDTLTDEFVKENMAAYGYSTAEEYLESERENYKSSLETQKKQLTANALDQKVYEESDFSGVPKKEMEKTYKEQLDSIKQQAKESGMSVEDYLTQSGYTEDTFKTAFEENYKKVIMYQAMIKESDYTFNTKQADEQIAYYAAMYGMDTETLLQMYGGAEELYRSFAYSSMLEDMAQEAIDQGRVTFTDADGKAIATSSPAASPRTWYIIAGFLFAAAVITGAILYRGSKEDSDAKAADGQEPAEQTANDIADAEEDKEDQSRNQW